MEFSLASIQPSLNSPWNFPLFGLFFSICMLHFLRYNFNKLYQWPQRVYGS